jgi:BirA family biotin operon repressor/biotin-[acetyl-CoA-carboxylase] ligase
LIRTVRETGSTNSDLIGLAHQGAEEGDWLRADRQTGGRGRHGRTWQSPEGNLHASTLVRVRPGDPPAPTLALVGAVALHDASERFAPGLRIKWPNDLVAGNAKIAGILLEREGDAVVAGFGVNLVAHPENLDRPTTCLAAIAGQAPGPDEFLAELARAFAGRLHQWRSFGLDPIRKDWLERAHPVGTALETSHGTGQFDGLDPDGALRLRLADGSRHVIHAGDIFLI